jgi:5-methylcytosine-specific restriction protein A
MQKICPVGHYYSGDACPQCNNTASRGYDHRWRKLSEDYRIRNPLCEDCDAKGRTTAASEVHHIVPISQDPSKRLDVNNLVSLCKLCHEIRHGKNLDQK